MKKIDFSETFVYKWRYWIGYGLIAVGVIVTLILAGLYIPGGLSEQEMQSVVISSATKITDFQSIGIINLPYYLLQHISIALFGVSILSVKLPSILLAFLSAAGLVLLVKSWFKPGIGILASLIAITTGQFMFIAQNGTPDIMFLFWSVWLLLLAGQIPIADPKIKKILVIALSLAAAISLYTPLSLYILLVFAVAVMLHPHLRFHIKQLSKTELAVGIVLILALVSPLIYALIKTPKIGLTLLGFPIQWPDISSNLATLGSQYFNFVTPGGTTLLSPFFELGTTLIIAIGIYYVIKTRETAKSYTIGLWALFLVPIIILNPNYTAVSFLPLVLLLASGIKELLGHWYILFPNNPYARIIGLVPLTILVSALIFSGIYRYIYEYTYNPSLVTSFSKDLRLIPKNTRNIVVSQDELPFYSVVAKYDKDLLITLTPRESTFLSTRAARQNFIGYEIKQIITTSTSQNGDRFYLYSKTTK